MFCRKFDKRRFKNITIIAPNGNTPDSTFKMQKDSPIWNKTTMKFKKYQNTIIKENGYD